MEMNLVWIDENSKNLCRQVLKISILCMLAALWCIICRIVIVVAEAGSVLRIGSFSTSCILQFYTHLLQGYFLRAYHFCRNKSDMRSILLSLAFFLLTVAHSMAQSKPPLSVQGTLKNSDGTSVTDGRYNMTFRLYTASSGGTAIWTETQNNVSVRSGVYSVQLGSVNPINITFTENLFLGTTVGSGAEIVPRTRLTSSPYALYAFRLGNDVPLGFVMPWASGSTTGPDGWLLCDGRALKSTEYPDLFSAIGTLWGNGSKGIGAGSGTDFNLPDLRGEFIRGAAAGANAGAQQEFTTAKPSGLRQNGADVAVVVETSNDGNHEHTLSSTSGYNRIATTASAPGNLKNGRINGYPAFSGFENRWSLWYSSVTFPTAGQHTHTVTPNNTGGDSETRPRNVAMAYFIKIRN
jgi:microcystin-dependent protein